MAILVLRLFGSEEKRDATGYHPGDSQGEFGPGPLPEPEERAAHEAELEKAAHEWDVLRRETDTPNLWAMWCRLPRKGLSPKRSRARIN